MRGFDDNDFRVMDREAQRSSDIKHGIAGRIATFQKIYCDLNTAKLDTLSVKISPFRSVFVRSASDSTAVVYFSPNENSVGSLAEALPLYKNDSFDFEITQSGGYLWWPAQAGKTMELFLSTQGAMKAGSQLSQIAGGISLSSGSARSSIALGPAGNSAAHTITASPTVLLAADPDRKVATLYTTSDCWIGDASVAVGTRGNFWAANTSMKDTNTAALYVIGSSGGTITGTVEE